MNVVASVVGLGPIKTVGISGSGVLAPGPFLRFLFVLGAGAVATVERGFENKSLGSPGCLAPWDSIKVRQREGPCNMLIRPASVNADRRSPDPPRMRLGPRIQGQSARRSVCGPPDRVGLQQAPRISSPVPGFGDDPPGVLSPRFRRAFVCTHTSHDGSVCPVLSGLREIVHSGLNAESV